MNYKSVLQIDTEHCYFCGWYASEWHHIFNASFKKKSEKYGAMVRLCHNCHNEYPDGVHHSKERREKLRAEAQRRIMQENQMSMEDWRNIFEINYL